MSLHVEDAVAACAVASVFIQMGLWCRPRVGESEKAFLQGATL